MNGGALKDEEIVGVSGIDGLSLDAMVGGVGSIPVICPAEKWILAVGSTVAVWRFYGGWERIWLRR